MPTNFEIKADEFESMNWTDWKEKPYSTLSFEDQFGNQAKVQIPSKVLDEELSKRLEALLGDKYRHRVADLMLALEDAEAAQKQAKEGLDDFLHDTLGVKRGRPPKTQEDEPEEEDPEDQVADEPATDQDAEEEPVAPEQGTTDSFGMQE